MAVRVFKSETVGVGSWCVEFPGGAVISTRTEERAHRIALAYLLRNASVWCCEKCQSKASDSQFHAPRYLHRAQETLITSGLSVRT
jgi:hypothetical protein